MKAKSIVVIYSPDIKASLLKVKKKKIVKSN